MQVGSQRLDSGPRRPALWPPGSGGRNTGRARAKRRSPRAEPPKAVPAAAPASQRYRVHKQGRHRFLTCIEAPTLRVRIERGFSVSGAAARSFETGSIFLDGAAQGEPFIDAERGVYNLDHHEGCIRAFTMATCEQAMILMRKRLDLRKRDFTLYANEPDLDTILAIWVLLNHLRLSEEGSRARAEIMPLLRLEGCIDALGLELQDLCALPPDLFRETRQRMDGLLARERALKADGRWERMDFAQYLATQLRRIDQMVYTRQELAGSVEIEELARASVGRDSVAVVCRSQSGIYEVERQLRRVHGDRLGLVILQKNESTYSVRQVDPSLAPNLDKLYARLNLLDPASDGIRSPNRWGGSEEIGGSPRVAGTRMSPRQIATACTQAHGNPGWKPRLAQLGRALAFCALGLAAGSAPLWGGDSVPGLTALSLDPTQWFAAVLFILAGVALLLLGRRGPGIYGMRAPCGLDWWWLLPLAALGALAGGVWIPAAGAPTTLASLADLNAWLALLLVPAAAELLFRGLVHGSLVPTFAIQSSGGSWSLSAPALLTSCFYSVWIALPLLAPLSLTRVLLEGPPLATPMLGAFAFGLAAAMARERSESVLAPVAFHWLCVAGVLAADRLGF